MYGKHHKKDPNGDAKFFYENINGNGLQSKKPSAYNYNVRDHNDLAKLYLQPRMVKFEKIKDGSFDASSALSVLSTASCFQTPLQDTAREVRDNVRNIWGHFNDQDWTDQKFLDCFRLFELLVIELKLNKREEDELICSIEEWKKDGKAIMNHCIAYHNTCLTCKQLEVPARSFFDIRLALQSFSTFSEGLPSKRLDWTPAVL